jgi:alpha-tubulin suppressor-like RCC1 family protein
VLDTGEVWSFGRDTFGQLGNGPGGASQVPVQVANLSGVLDVAAGTEHSLALDVNGTVWAWGRDTYGQLGQGGAPASSQVPLPVLGLPGPAIDIAAGGDHSMALLSDGTVWVWGRDTFGQLGNGGTSANSPVPVLANLPLAAFSIAGGRDHALAVLSDGTVWSWGSDTSGQLGDGSGATSSQQPVQVAGIDGGGVVSAGISHSVVLRFDDLTVWSWGADVFGQLGDGPPFTGKFAPVAVAIP